MDSAAEPGSPAGQAQGTRSPLQNRPRRPARALGARPPASSGCCWVFLLQRWSVKILSCLRRPFNVFNYFTCRCSALGMERVLLKQALPGPLSPRMTLVAFHHRIFLSVQPRVRQQTLRHRSGSQRGSGAGSGVESGALLRDSADLGATASFLREGGCLVRCCVFSSSPGLCSPRPRKHANTRCDNHTSLQMLTNALRREGQDHHYLRSNDLGAAVRMTKRPG